MDEIGRKSKKREIDKRNTESARMRKTDRAEGEFIKYIDTNSFALFNPPGMDLDRIFSSVVESGTG